MKKIFQKISLVLLGILIAITAVESGLRIYYFLGENKMFGLKPARSTLKFYDNDIFGHALVANQVGWFVPHTKEYITKVEVNSHGWPDVEHSYDKPPDIYRIVILGDSFVENTQLPLEERFFRILEKNLNSQNYPKKIEVIAIGRGNTGTAQQYLILKNYALKYKPDLVIHMFLTANDIKNNSSILQNDPYLPYFKLDSSGELEEIPHTKRQDRSFARIKEIFKSLRITELLLGVRQKIREGKDNVKLGGYPADYHVYDQIYSDEYQKAWAVTQKLLEESRKETKKIGAEYILVTLANNEQANRDVLDGLYKAYPEMKNANLDFEKPDKLIADFCASKNFTCSSMLSFFKEYMDKNPGSRTHNFYEGHWNKTGTNLAAEFLTEKIKLFLDEVVFKN